jgi:calcium-translocating P-type ATPase
MASAQTDRETARPPDAPTRGLTSAQAAAALEEWGPNLLPPPPSPNVVWHLLRQFTHLFALMLWVAAGLAVLAGMPELTVAIVVVIVVNGVFAFLQEHRADAAAARLRELVPADATVVRDGEARTVPASEVVPGDLVLVGAGERICADLRLTEAHGLSVDASMLTGESVAEHPQRGDGVACGTFVLEGEAAGQVTATGSHTRFAAIAGLTQRAHRGRSPLAKQLARVVHAVSGLATATGLALFGVATLLGLPAESAFLFALGVTVALVPEGLLPTVTLSLARGAQHMAHRRVLVRRLEAVETLGSTTYICTDKTGTLTLNQMAVLRVWTPSTGSVILEAAGYAASTPFAEPCAPAVAEVLQLAASTMRGRAIRDESGRWRAHGDPMEVALDVAARRAGRVGSATEGVLRRLPYSAARRRSSVVLAAPGQGPVVVTVGAPESLARVTEPDGSTGDAAVEAMARAGLRVLAVATRPAPDWRDCADEDLEDHLVLQGVIGLEDPPRDDVAAAVARCREAGIRIAVVTGDHPATALAVAREVGLADDTTRALVGAELPKGLDELADLLTPPGPVVVARVSPEEKLRIAEALRHRGFVVAMTGDGVNDGPALRAADVGVAMGASGSDVAREAADVVLLDDHFGSIVDAIELGRSTFANIRRFLTYHLTDNVAELAPFVLWALTTGSVPLAIGVMQVLALDIATDLLPALALGAEQPHAGVMRGPVRRLALLDRAVLARALLVLGPAEALGSLATFWAVLSLGGWRWGQVPDPTLAAAASGATFLAIVTGQVANAYACRSTTAPVWARRLGANRLLRVAVLVDVALCLVFITVPPLPTVLGGTWPPVVGLVGALATGCLVVLVDAAQKRVVRRPPTRRRAPTRGLPA